MALSDLNPQASQALRQYADVYGAHDLVNAATPGGGWSLANIIGGIIFGGVGFIAFVYGKKMSSWRPMAIGIALIIYPYFVPNTTALYLIGIGLSACLYFFRE